MKSLCYWLRNRRAMREKAAKRMYFVRFDIKLLGGQRSYEKRNKSNFS